MRGQRVNDRTKDVWIVRQRWMEDKWDTVGVWEQRKNGRVERKFERKMMCNLSRSE